MAPTNRMPVDQDQEEVLTTPRSDHVMKEFDADHTGEESASSAPFAASVTSMAAQSDSTTSPLCAAADSSAVDDAVSSHHAVTKVDMVTVDVSEPSSSEPSGPIFSFKSLLIIYGVVIADGVAMNIINPFISDICEKRFGVSSSNVGTAAGWLVGAFSIAVFLSGFFIGHLSDIYGRKKLMLMGLASGCVCTLFFGISTSFALALVLRLLSGLTNSNVALTRSVISDVPSSQMTPEQRSLAFGYMSGFFQASRAVAAAVAGVTTGVHVFGYDNDYFLPCLLGASLNFVFLLFGATHVPETLPRRKARPAILKATSGDALAVPTMERRLTNTANDSPQSTDQPTPRQSTKYHQLGWTDSDGQATLLGGSIDSAHHHVESGVVEAHVIAMPVNAAVAAAHPPLIQSVAIASSSLTSPPPTEFGLDVGMIELTPSSSSAALVQSVPVGMVKSLNSSDDAGDHDDAAAPSCSELVSDVMKSLAIGLRIIWADVLIRRINLLACLHSFGNGSFILLITLFGSLELAEGGLELTTARIGITYFWFGMVCLAFQLFVYKHLHRRFGLYHTYLVGTLVLGASATAIPLTAYIKQYENNILDINSTDDLKYHVVSTLYYFFVLMCLACGFMVCQPIVSTCLSHCVQGSPYRGLTQGVTQSLQSGMRGIGAAFIGTAFTAVATSTQTPGIIYWCLAAINVVCFFIAYRFTPEEIDRCTGKHEEARVAAERATAATMAAHPGEATEFEPPTTEEESIRADPLLPVLPDDPDEPAPPSRHTSRHATPSHMPRTIDASHQLDPPEMLLRGLSGDRPAAAAVAPSIAQELEAHVMAAVSARDYTARLLQNESRESDDSTSDSDAHFFDPTPDESV